MIILKILAILIVASVVAEIIHSLCEGWTIGVDKEEKKDYFNWPVK